jgi:hypothetical protein
MPPTRTLPPAYILTSEINLSKNRWLAIALNAVGLVLFFITFWALGLLANGLRPGAVGDALVIDLGLDLVWTLLGFIGLMLLNLVIHEAIHGFFFWLFTRSRPAFALRLSYAYAAAPEWYIPRGLYWIIGLAPLLIIDAACLLLILVAPPGWLVPLALLIAFNTSGAVGDLLIVGKVAFAASGCLINDRGDSVAFYETHP